MTDSFLKRPRVLKVSEVNGYIKGLLSYDGVLSSMWVSGEISNYKRHYSGHLYFDIKDSASKLKCVMFKSNAEKLVFEPENGMKVLIRGGISVFERDGMYQLYAEDMRVDGIGDLHTAFEQLKKKLSSEGLFDERYKKPIPFMPRKIGVITSDTGSVIKDIVNVMSRRYYPIELKLLPCQVQGEGAGARLVSAVRFFNRRKCCDVLILARGGGSLEDLWPFNEEVLARAIADSEIPIISAVGHETDFTICDFTADLRAPTPSAAAELAVPELSQIKSRLSQLSQRVNKIPYLNLEVKKNQLKNISSQTFFSKPTAFLEDRKLELDSLLSDLIYFAEDTGRNIKNKNSLMAARLDALSPLKILSRGYSAVVDSDGSVVKSVKNTDIGDLLHLHLNDGVLDCSVEKKEVKNVGR